jgi:hypothetical protein
MFVSKAISGAVVLTISTAAGAIGMVFFARIVQTLMRQYWMSQRDGDRTVAPVRREDVRWLVISMTVGLVGLGIAMFLIAA